MSGKQSGGHRLAKRLAVGASLGLLVWLLISAAPGIDLNTPLLAIGAVVMAAGLAAGALLIQWAERFSDHNGREGHAQPAKIYVDHPRYVTIDEREDD